MGKATKLVYKPFTVQNLFITVRYRTESLAIERPALKHIALTIGQENSTQTKRDRAEIVTFRASGISRVAFLFGGVA
jgi:hypothetical protein